MGCGGGRKTRTRMVRRLRRKFFIIEYGCRSEIEEVKAEERWWSWLVRFETFWLSNLYMVGHGSVPSEWKQKNSNELHGLVSLKGWVDCGEGGFVAYATYI